MSATATKASQNQREVNARIYKPKYQEKLVPTFLIGDGSNTSFVVPDLHEPFQVFNAGILQREGAGDEYTIVSDGLTTTVEFAIAPPINDITIYSYVRLV